MTDQSIDATKVQIGQLVNFLGITWRHMGDVLLTGVEMTL